MSWGGFFRSILGLPGVTPVVSHLIPLPGDTLSPEDQATEQRIQKVLDTDPDLVAAKQRGAGADELENLLRSKGLPMGGSAWRLRESTSTSSGFRPTLAMSKKRGAAYTAAGVAGGVGGAAAAGGFAGSGAAGGAAAGGGAGAGTAATGGALASHAIAPTFGALAPGVAASGAVPTAFGAGAAAAGGAASGVGGGGSAWGSSTAARIAKSGIGAIVSGVMSKRAQDQAMQRSPEELAALAGSNKIAGQLSGQGGDLLNQGAGNTAAAAQFFNTLLHGNRAQMAQATAGPRKSITDVYGGAQRGLERSGLRGAEKDVASGELNRQQAGQISALTTGMQPGAAQALHDIGSGQTGAGAGMLGASGSIFSNLLGAGTLNRYYARQQGQDAGSTWGNLAGSLLSAYLGGR